jgi:hypothetical protein
MKNVTLEAQVIGLVVLGFVGAAAISWLIARAFRDSDSEIGTVIQTNNSAVEREIGGRL